MCYNNILFLFLISSTVITANYHSKSGNTPLSQDKTRQGIFSHMSHCHLHGTHTS